MHPPAGIGAVGEGPVPAEGREVVGTTAAPHSWGWGRSAVGRPHSTCGKGVGMLSLERAHNKVGTCVVQ